MARAGARTGSPVRAAIVSALVAADSSVSGAGCERTKPRDAQPPPRPRAPVSAQWFTVPSRFAATIEQRQREPRGEVRPGGRARRPGRAGRRRPRRGARPPRGARRATSATSRSTSIVTPSSARGDGGRERRAQAVGADVVERRRIAGGGAQARAASSGLGVDAGLDRLHHRDAEPARAERRARARRRRTSCRRRCRCR